MRTLILVDIQNDFLPGGALAVPDGDAIVPVVNRVLPQFDLVVATQDWHPADHGSFAVNHAGRKVFEQVDLNGLPQTLWPAHCVQHTGGALFASGLATRIIAGCTWQPSATSSHVTPSAASTAPARPGARWVSGGMRLKRWVA